MFAPFSTNVSLLHPLKTSQNLRFSDVFRGYRSGKLVENGAKTYLVQEQCYTTSFARFGTIYTILKALKTNTGVLLLVKLQAFTESNTLLWVLFTFFKMYKWYKSCKASHIKHEFKSSFKRQAFSNSYDLTKKSIT